ncbi:MAG TPA: sigma-70 family RNA polymerase sigma factor [Candidatus Omnitrophota bacterium]|nr:sigma-70 family RNA polymerase sigma factor [Candidatus Omnitrophota bacterium]
MTGEGVGLVRTQDLLRGAKEGRRDALEALFARYRPRLERWAAGRLPSVARSLFDTGDLVQETLLRALENIGSIEVRGPGGFEAYVRQAILNRIRDQVRWARRREGSPATSEDLVDRGPSPLEHAIGADVIRRFEEAMLRLGEEERQLLHLRIELDLGYEEIAALMGRPSPDSARMAIQRALHKLAFTMGHPGR